MPRAGKPAYGDEDEKMRSERRTQDEACEGRRTERGEMDTCRLTEQGWREREQCTVYDKGASIVVCRIAFRSWTISALIS